MTRLSVGMAQDPEYYIISYNVISSTTPTRVSIHPDDVCDDDSVCRYIVMDEFNRGTQYEVYMAVSNFVGSEGSAQCNNAISMLLLSILNVLLICKLCIIFVPDIVGFR